MGTANQHQSQHLAQRERQESSYQLQAGVLSRRQSLLLKSIAIMAEEIVIDKNTFFNRLSSFYAAWKADKRSGNTVFGGVGSIVILMGKTDEANSFQKNNAMHVRFTLTAPIIAPLLLTRSFSSGFLDMSFRQPF